MNKLYYNQNFIASKLITFFSIISLIDSESVVTADLANSFNSALSSNNTSSIQKRFWRFFNNKNVNIMIPIILLLIILSLTSIMLDIMN